MFIIHGSRNKTHDHGYVLQLTCDRCKSAGWWKLIQETESKTLYFASITSNDRYHLFCEKCGNSVLLNMDQTQRAFY